MIRLKIKLCLSGTLILLGLTASVAYTQTETLASASPFPVGLALTRNFYKNPDYARLAALEFSSVTAENVMKPRYISIGPDRYYWQAADSVVDFCRKNKMQLHGHTLVWNKSVPDWVKEFKGDSTAWEGILKRYIQDVANHFKGKVVSWDVVNEALNYEENIKKDGIWRNSIWLQHLGKDYVARCFQYARQADPSAKLFYNDYKVEADTLKLAGMLHMLDDFIERGIPIDGVGLQMHITMDTPEPGIRRVIREVARRGLLVHISELDVSVNPGHDSVIVKEKDELLKRQADKVRQIVTAFMEEVPPKQRFAITTWGLTDANSWLAYKKEDYPLLFDRNFKPKAAYYAFLKGLTKKYTGQ